MFTNTIDDIKITTMKERNLFKELFECNEKFSNEIWNTLKFSDEKMLGFIKAGTNYNQFPSFVADSLIEEIKQLEKNFKSIENIPYGINDIVIKTKLIPKEYLQKDKIIIPVRENDLLEIPIKQNEEGRNPFLIKIFQNKFSKIIVKYVYFENEKANHRKFALGIDLGIHNLAACLSNKDGFNFIIDGKPIKKAKHDCKFICDKIKNKNSKKSKTRIEQAETKRNNKIKDYIGKTAKYLVKYCLLNNIGTIVIGYNKDAKNVYIFQHKQLIEQMKVTCKRSGINLKIVSEYGTSKTDLLANEPLPKKGEKRKYLGVRNSKEALFYSSTGVKLHDDIQAAGNILRKGGHTINIKKIDKNIRVLPKKIIPTNL